MSPAKPPKIVRYVLKDALHESRLFTNRVVIIWLLMLCGICGLMIRLVYLQLLEHERYTMLSDSNRVRIMPLPPTRGLIFDRHGVLLADNRAAYSLEIVPEQAGNVDNTLNELKKIIALDENEITRFKKQVKQKRSFDSIPIRFRLTEDEMARFSVQHHRFPGVDINSNLSRYYPLGESAVHVIGYVGRINEEELKNIDISKYRGLYHIGKTGVEKSYEDEIHGLPGYQEVETNVQGRVLRILKSTPPVPGHNLYLNIDINMQMYIENLLKDEKAAVVAIEPSTGGVIAMVSTPMYDPNLFVNGIAANTYRELLNAPERPLYNRALRGNYPPGSTIKAFVGLAGLEYGIRTESTRTYCRGWVSLPNSQHKYRDWKRSGHGSINFIQSVEQSCDVYYYELAQDLGIDRLHSFMTRFGFGKLTGIDLDSEIKGLMPSREWKERTRKANWFQGETMIAGIGQGYVLATPLQLAHATATLAMRGVAMQPRVVFALDKAAGTENMQVVSGKPQPRVTLKDDSYWVSAIRAMEAVIYGGSGTARKIGVSAPYRIAGKTGTAQVVQIRQGERYNARLLQKKFHDHALFIAFAPVENPRIAVAVIVENGGSGSGTAAPLARKVMDYYLAPHLVEKNAKDAVIRVSPTRGE